MMTPKRGEKKIEISTDLIWDVVEEIMKRGIKRLSIQPILCTEDQWFRDMYLLSKLQNPSLTDEMWKHIYSFSTSFHKNLLERKEELSSGEYIKSKPLQSLLKYLEAENLGRFDWLIVIREEGLDRDFKDSYRKISNMIEGVVQIYGLEANEPNLVKSRNFMDEVIKRVADLTGARAHVERMKEKKDVEGLIRALKHEAGSVRLKAAEALGTIGDARAVEPLIQGLKDKHVEARWRAALALGMIGDARAVEPLIQSLKDKERFVRRSATWALGKIGDVRAMEPLTQALKDKHEDVQKAAKEALEKINKKEK